MSAGYITTGGSDRYHTGVDCPAFQRGVRGSEAQGNTLRPVIPLTPEQAGHVRQTPCPECCGGSAR
ncbi:hypothetical protein [Streptomyces jeddahensis]|uniref:Uncharacterized protein n=1 Tax=Streptomyces jeddahensis TaxID=1716141 RepID=A0A177HUG6_9ACTN|nr:hypothetical protein [Streptomyces jeddahensis]OAH14622.1 hypothetical protein STSP_21330 [Streptomyces jeddahensis]